MQKSKNNIFRHTREGFDEKYAKQTLTRQAVVEFAPKHTASGARWPGSRTACSASGSKVHVEGKVRTDIKRKNE